MHHLILLNTRVLKLIHHHIPVAVLVHRKYIGMFGKKFNRQHNQIIKIHRIKQLEPRLIFVVQRTIHRRLRRKVFLPRLYLRKQRPHSVHIERLRRDFQFLRRLLNQLIAVYLVINAKVLPRAGRREYASNVFVLQKLAVQNGHGCPWFQTVATF